MSESSTESLSQPTQLQEENNAYRKTVWHLLPLLMLCYVLNYLDRVNVGLPSSKWPMTCNSRIRFMAWGRYVLYRLLFPGNSQQPDTASSWRKVVDCADHDHLGIISACMAFVTTPMSFYVMRFLLGVAEAGFPRDYSLYFILVSVSPPWPRVWIIRHLGTVIRHHRGTTVRLDHAVF